MSRTVLLLTAAKGCSSRGFYGALVQDSVAPWLIFGHFMSEKKRTSVCLTNLKYKETMSHFNQAARQWDNPEKIERAKVYARAIKKKVRFPKPIRLLDLGCGTGLLSFEFREEACAILGVDTSSEMLAVFSEKGVPGAQALELDLEAQDLEGHGQFDLVVSSLAFHHFANPLGVLRSLKKVLAPEGRIAVVDLDREDGSFHANPQAQGVKHFGFAAEDAEDWAREAGLKLESREIIQEMEKNGRSYPVFLAMLLRA